MSVERQPLYVNVTVDIGKPQSWTQTGSPAATKNSHVFSCSLHVLIKSGGHFIVAHHVALMFLPASKFIKYSWIRTSRQTRVMHRSLYLPADSWNTDVFCTPLCYFLKRKDTGKVTWIQRTKPMIVLVRSAHLKLVCSGHAHTNKRELDLNKLKSTLIDDWLTC